MDNANDKRLSFPQRNWLLLCIIVAVVSPLLVHLVHAAARKHRYAQATETHDTTAKGNDIGNKSVDTAYKVANPPSIQPNPGAAGGDSATKPVSH